MDINKLFQSKAFKGVLFCVGAFVILSLIFGLGMFVGFRKAGHSYRWGENYERNFGGPPRGFVRGFMGDFMGRDFMGAHGIAGQIIKIDSSTLVIKGRNNIEEIVVIKNDTVITRFRETVKLSDLKVDDQIVVIGQPNNTGQIEAKFIRVMPAAPPNTSPTATSSPINQ